MLAWLRRHLFRRPPHVRSSTYARAPKDPSYLEACAKVESQQQRLVTLLADESDLLRREHDG